MSTIYEASFENDYKQEKRIKMISPVIIFYRNGLAKDILDERTKPLLHIIENIIPKSQTLKYILVENVKGFECSLARDKLVSTLRQSGFTYREFLLSPVHFGICNSRLRYYLLAKKKPLDFVISLQNNIVSFFSFWNFFINHDHLESSVVNIIIL